MYYDMKKKLLLLTFIALSCACNKTEEMPEKEWNPETDAWVSDMYGEWAAVITYVEETTADGEFISARGYKNGAERRVFRKDGSGSISVDLGGEFQWTDLYTFKWTASGNKISFTDWVYTPPSGIIIGMNHESHETEWTVNRFTAKDMKVSYTRKNVVEPDKGRVYRYTVTYERVK
jgi:hypothetical protein